jgi:hypothetical protein
MCNIKTRHNNNLYLPQPRISVYQREVHYIGIKVFNKLPAYIKDLQNNKKKTAYKNSKNLSFKKFFLFFGGIFQEPFYIKISSAGTFYFTLNVQ